VAVPLQLIGGGDADHAAAEHHYAHDEFTLPPERRADPAVDCVCSAKRRFIVQRGPIGSGRDKTAAIRLTET